MTPPEPRHVLRSLACVAGVGLCLAFLPGCDVALDPAYPGGAYVDYPSAAFVATTDPWYFEGRPSYWYGGQWYYRDRGGWGRYAHEPEALRQRRLQGAPGRHVYEPPAGRAPGRGGKRSGGRR